MRHKTGLRYSRKSSLLGRIAFILFATEGGLLFTYVVLIVILAFTIGPMVASIFVMGSLTLLLMLMIAVAMYIPPARPFREMSLLAARVADLAKVASGAALFGAAAAYGGAVGALMSSMPIDEAMSLDVVWGIVWPILSVATTLGASFVGFRLGWDLRRSDHRARLLAIARLRARLPDNSMKHHFIIRWLAFIVIAGIRSGGFIIVGYLAPVIVVADVVVGVACVRAIG